MNVQMKAKQQKGFTIIELVVVILLLGILAATALPRFLDVTDEAHEAVFNATVGGFTTGVALYRAQYVAEGQPGSVTLETSSLPFDTTRGYPRVDDSIPADLADGVTSCITIYNSVLQTGRPTIVASNDLDASNVPFTVGNTLQSIALNAATAHSLTLTAANMGTTVSDFQVALSVGDLTGPILPTCYFIYTGQYRNAEAAAAASDTLPVFTYAANGNIRIGTIGSTNLTFTRD